MRRRYGWVVMLSLLLGLSACQGQSRELLGGIPDIVEEKETEIIPETILETETEGDIITDGSPDGMILEFPEVVSAGEDIRLKHLLVSNVKVDADLEELVDNKELGKKTITIPYSYNGQRYSKDFEYLVEDTEAPVLFTASRNINVKVGWNFDPAAYASYGDNYDPAPKAGYSGHLDLNTVGQYAIVAYIEDASGNRAKWNMNVNVVNTLPQKPSGGGSSTPRPKFDFSTIRDKYPGEQMQYGIDVSKWQGNIDFQKVKEAGCEFVIMRIGHHGSSLTMDTQYLNNMKKAKEAGLKVGVYLYTSDYDEEQCREHARWVVEQLDGMALDFPIAFDWENWEDFPEYGISFAQLDHLFNAFYDEVAKSGYTAMLYSSKNYLEKVWKNNNQYPVWLANYVEQTEYAGEYFMWQFSCVGKIDGISGDVDLDLVYTDRINWDK